MASSSLRNRVVLAIVSLLSLGAVYWFVFSGKTPDWFSPEEINDMFQNKKSDVSVKRVELSEQGISSPYLDRTTLKPVNWDHSGDLIVYNGQHISLTSSGKHQASNMFSKKPLNAESFEMELTFHLHSKESIMADGMAVWFLEQPSPLGDVFGVQNNFKGLGIVIDTFRNGVHGDFPLVSAQYSPDPLFYDKNTDGLNTQIASCTAKSLVNPASGKTRMRVVHTKNGYLSVDFNYDPDHSGEWHNCFSVMDVKLPSQSYLGLSAETGQMFETVDIIESKIFALYSPDGDHFIESVDELETIMQQQAPSDEPNNSRDNKRVRKSLLRLRNAERRIKEQERAYRLEKYGDADATFVRRWSSRIFAGLKYALYFFLVIFVVWVVRIFIKTKRSKRSYRSTGLLD
ncbi:hypothetical protein JCM33374_g2970 [Metschnikowia sp. JCM 33374]|nr:hypothetical protein JCM33374_g2970 [Metschnikowia sp. JCM 33374]